MRAPSIWMGGLVCRFFVESDLLPGGHHWRRDKVACCGALGKD